jgi:hypothetical protein
MERNKENTLINHPEPTARKSRTGDADGKGEVTAVFNDSLNHKIPAEFNGPKGPEPTRYGDWEQKGRCTDF